MHEQALMVDVTRKLEQTARDGGADRVTRVEVRLGALSHFSPEHFREHFVDATRGTVAEGAEVIATLDRDLSSPNASDVIIETVELEFADSPEAR